MTNSFTLYQNNSANSIVAASYFAPTSLAEFISGANSRESNLVCTFSPSADLTTVLAGTNYTGVGLFKRVGTVRIDYVLFAGGSQVGAIGNVNISTSAVTYKKITTS